MNPNSSSTHNMPVLFLGHGSPMNAIEKNTYTDSFKKLGREIPRPKAVLVISAHWETIGTKLLTTENPKTIHDFYGFPKALFEVQYPAPGAGLALHTLIRPPLEESFDWGLDHGTWSVLIHLFPDASIPVTQLSMDQNLSFAGHLEIGRRLSSLREKGVLIIGSGNLVHNLREIDWEPNAPARDYATEFDGLMKNLIIHKKDEELTRLQKEHSALTQKAHPTLDHFIPLLYTVGASLPSDERSFPVEGIQNGSISMRSVRFG